jgi:nucleotide-binding universal stress UspA family protein
MNELLVAVDGSDHSAKVVDYASELAKSLTCDILLVSVVHLPSQEPEAIAAFEKAEGYPDAYADYLRRLGDDVTAKLSQRIEKSGVKCRSIVPTGNAASEIVWIAERESAKMIVIGLKGLHGLAKISSLGSIARRVIENSTKPIVVVP